jgi:hypothetical protein
VRHRHLDELCVGRWSFGFLGDVHEVCILKAAARSGEHTDDSGVSRSQSVATQAWAFDIAFETAAGEASPVVMSPFQKVDWANRQEW